MIEKPFQNCPKCNELFENGFLSRTAGLSFASAKNFEQHTFLDEDIVQAGLKKILPSKGEWYRSYLCRSCEVYLVDYSVSLDRQEVNELANSLV